MPSYVIIWENNTFGHMKVKGHVWSGHTALNIGTTFAKTTEVADNDNSYVSWWPVRGVDFKVPAMIKNVFQKAKTGRVRHTFTDDLVFEEYLPDHVIRLDTSAEQENDMRAAWRAVFLKDGGSTYKSLRKNCSTIVSRVLHAGGFYAKKWAVDCNFAWSPADIRKLALAAGGEAMQWPAFLEVLAENDIRPADFKNFEGDSIYQARSGRYCTTGAPCKYQKNG